MNRRGFVGRALAALAGLVGLFFPQKVFSLEDKSNCATASTISELKDKTQYHQMLMQLHNKQVISTQTLFDEIGLNYDEEVKRMREVAGGER